MKIDVKVTGIDKMVTRLDLLARRSDVRRVVEKNTNQLVTKTQRAAKFKQGYSTGETKASIKSVTRDGGYTGAVMPMTEYSIHLIYGTRHMAPQDFVRPPLYEQRDKFIREMIELLK